MDLDKSAEIYQVWAMRIRQHVNPLAKRFAQLTPELPDDIGDRAIEVEVGCADAKFLFERYKQDNTRYYIGLEIRQAWVDTVNQRAEAQDIALRAIYCHANHHYTQLFGEDTIARAFVNFPDPWFKRKHRKRRMVNGQLIKDIATSLKAGGDLLFQSDFEPAALEAQAALQALGQMTRLTEGPWADQNPFDARSWREEHCQKQGRKIWRLHYQKS